MKKLFLSTCVTITSFLLTSNTGYAHIYNVKGTADITEGTGGKKNLNCNTSENLCYRYNTDDGLVEVYEPGRPPKIYGSSVPPVLDPIQNQDGSYNQIGSFEIEEQ